MTYHIIRLGDLVEFGLDSEEEREVAHWCLVGAARVGGTIVRSAFGGWGVHLVRLLHSGRVVRRLLVRVVKKRLPSVR